MNANDLTPRRRDVVVSVIVFAAALAVRVGYLAQISDTPLFAHAIGDAAGFDAWAARIAGTAEHDDEVTAPGFTEQSAPVYPYFLAAVQRLFGRDYWRMRLVQAVVGALACVMLYWAGRAFAGRTAGGVAAILLALYPPAIYYEVQLQKGLLALTFMCAMLWALGSAARRPAWWRWLLAGVALGLISLDRENGLVLAAVLPVWLSMYLRQRAWKARLAGMAVFLAGAGLALLPAAVRNWRATGRFALGTSNIGPNFYIGNNPNAHGAYMSLRPGHGSSMYERTDAKEIAEEAMGRELTPQEVSRYWLAKSFAYIREQPGDWARLMALKWLRVWNRIEIADTVDYYMFAEWSSLLRRLNRVLHFGVLFPLAAAGVVWSSARRRDLSVLYVVVPTLTAAIALFLVMGRYRLVLVPGLLILCGAGVAAVPGLWRQRRRALLAWGLVALLAGALLANWPLRSPAGQAAAARTNLGLALLAQGRLDEALNVLSEAVRIDPGIAEAHNNLGNAYRRAGDNEKAVTCYREAIRLSPEMAEAWHNLGGALAKLERTEESLAAYRQAAELLPRMPEAHYGMGMQLTALGRHAEAVAAYREAARLRPDQAAAWNNLGNALSRLGRSDEAIEAYRRAIELDPHLSTAYLNLAGELADAGRTAEAADNLRAGIAAGADDTRLMEMWRRLGEEAR
ncbi:MAG: tetratricopeptide repeat protein [Phycisphaerales bacterium]|nr:MAG: tetratricopeptide repeat protein [Phycisphaerales bacterium]